MRIEQPDLARMGPNKSFKTAKDNCRREQVVQGTLLGSEPGESEPTRSDHKELVAMKSTLQGPALQANTHT